MNQQILNAIHTDSVRDLLSKLFVDARPTKDSLVHVTKTVVDRLISYHTALSPFTKCTKDDYQIDVDGSSTLDATIAFQATTPRGALFLGELASVGFFGLETEAALS